CRRHENGTITIFDNGNHNDPRESRVVEYDIDEENKTATLIWQYRNDPLIIGLSLGSAQRLENGNTLIGWGSTNPNVTEVRSDGSKAFELTFAEGVVCYRAFRFDWEGEARTPYLWVNSDNDIFTLHFTKFGDRHVKAYNIYRGLDLNLVDKVATTHENRYEVRDVVVGTTEYFRVTAVDWSGNESPFSNEIAITPDYIDLSLTKTVDPPTAKVGNPVTFTVTVQNDGIIIGTGITVSDTLPIGYSYTSDTGEGAYDFSTGIWDVDSLAVGDTLSLDITATVLAAGSHAAYENSAQVASANEVDADSEPGNNDPTEDDQDSAGVIGVVFPPEIYAVRDVPGDQGGVVYLSWYASALDLVKDDHLSRYTI
ncbi:MAG: DUF11 domain-containing protein, partial [Candidatus Krumholzibacteria bacterium]|nr:DUF11 domain-containing protein [Candidatus Krumholzibacteria bacterium]